MSDIIYTPPASGGGGTTINPTNNFIPKRSNATTFVDSVLENGSDYLYSNYGGFTGLGLDFANFTSYLGDWNNLINGTTLVVNDQTNEIYTKFSGLVNGFALNFGASSYVFGHLGSNTILNMDYNNQYAQIQVLGIPYFFADRLNGFTQIGDARALVNCNNISNIVQIGDVNLSVNQNIFFIDDNNSLIGSRNAANDIGIYLDFLNNRYFFGDFNFINKNTHLYIEDANETIHFYTNFLDFNGAALVSGSAGGVSALGHLVLTINGTLCKIQLLDP